MKTKQIDRKIQQAEQRGDTNVQIYIQPTGKSSKEGTGNNSGTATKHASNSPSQLDGIFYNEDKHMAGVRDYH